MPMYSLRENVGRSSEDQDETGRNHPCYHDVRRDGQYSAARVNSRVA
jgi:hypothetical protein